MPVKCCVPVCKVQSDDPGAKSLSFHQLPKNQEERAKWLYELNRFFPTKDKSYLYVCSQHFESNCFSHTGTRLRIKKGFVPTIFAVDRLRTAEENTDSNSVAGDDYQNDVDTKNQVFIKACPDDEVVTDQVSIDDRRVAEIASDQMMPNYTSQNDVTEQVFIKPCPDDEVVIDQVSSDECQADEDAVDHCLVDNAADYILPDKQHESTDFTEYSVKDACSKKKCSKSVRAVDVSNKVKSLVNVNIDSIEATTATEKQMKWLLFLAQKEILVIRRRNRILSNRLYRLQKKVRSRRKNFVTDEVFDVIKCCVM
ncbi:uncharacterized protein LOC106644015 [Copidosoma floridanum]|uniref:uncharacterized protein LOC106644015 n=1 Tax=Copidosoma floridanum TaxID=29053 RepID=UPI0006C9C216|nr:uncharacterized protein LOC106644015 [Copidosoma floridanum]